MECAPRTFRTRGDRAWPPVATHRAPRGATQADEDTDRDCTMTDQLAPPVTSQAEQLAEIGKYQYGWADPDIAGASARRGLNEAVVRDISAKKNEPEWMRDLRLKALRLFERKPLPTWGADLSDIDFDNIKYFVRSTEKQATSWDELPEDIRRTYDIG